MAIFINESLLKNEFIGYHCSPSEIDENDFIGEITGIYMYNFYYTIINLLKANGLYDNYISDIREYEEAMEIAFDEEEFLSTPKEDVESFSEELAIIVHQLGARVIFVSDQRLTEYGELCYEVFMVNDNFEFTDDPNERAAFAYFFIEGKNKPVLKRTQ